MGKYLADDVAQAMSSGQKLTKQQERFIELFGSDPDKAAAAFVERTQGTYGFRGLPEFVMKGPFSQILSLSRFNIERANNFKRDVVDQARKGNVTPLMMTVFGTLVGGTVVEQLLNPLLAGGKKAKTPTWAEVEESEKNSAVAYKLAAVADAASISGILGSVIKMAGDKAMGNNTQGYNDLLLQTSGDLISNVNGAVQAYLDGEGDLDTFLTLTQKTLTSYNQNIRMLHSYLWNQDEISRQNKLRDLRVYKQGKEGETVPDVYMPKDQVQGAKLREFKHTKDIDEAKQLATELAQQAAQKVKTPADAKRELAKLTRISYATIPSPRTDRRKTTAYVQYLEKVQGKEKSQEVVEDYKKQTRLDDMKQQLVTREFYKALRLGNRMRAGE